MRKITPHQAQQIIQIACESWKETLANNWGVNIALLRDIQIDDDSYREMRRACTGPQHKLFDEIFGTDSVFKVGDWVTWSGHNPLTARIIRKDQIHENCWVLHEKTHNSCSEMHLRPATKDEILKAKTPIPGRKYKLQYSGEYCNLAGLSGEVRDGRQLIEEYTWVFVGEAITSNGKRNIFFPDKEHHTTMYLMMGTRFLEYIVEEVE